MANYKIYDETFLTILRVRENNNRADPDCIYKETKKSLGFEDVTKEFLDDRIHTFINDGKIINKLNQKADSYYVNSELVDLETSNLLNSSQSVIRIILTTTDSLLNSNDTLALSVNKTLQLQGVTSTPTIYSYEDTTALNIKETSVISKSANLSCIPNSTKSQKLDIHQKEQTITETENLRAEMIALTSFFVDQIYMMEKKIK